MKRKIIITFALVLGLMFGLSFKAYAKDYGKVQCPCGKVMKLTVHHYEKHNNSNHKTFFKHKCYKCGAPDNFVKIQNYPKGYRKETKKFRNYIYKALFRYNKHDYGKWSKSKNGKKVRTCKMCGYAQTKKKK